MTLEKYICEPVYLMPLISYILKTPRNFVRGEFLIFYRLHSKSVGHFRNNPGSFFFHAKTKMPSAYSAALKIPIENIPTEKIPAEKIPIEKVPAANTPTAYSPEEK